MLLRCCASSLPWAGQEAAEALDEDDTAMAALDTFCDKPPGGMQRKLTHAVEKRLHADAIQAARVDPVTSAFLKSCDGRWVRTPRLRHLQLSNEEATLRMQRYLRQPLSVLAGIVGKHGQDVKRTSIDQHGDGLLSGYKAEGDGKHIALHNALCRLLSTCASQANVSNALEGGKVKGTKKKPGDVRFRGDAGSLARLGACRHTRALDGHHCGLPCVAHLRVGSSRHARCGGRQSRPAQTQQVPH